MRAERCIFAGRNLRIFRGFLPVLPDLEENRDALRKRFELFTYLTYNKLRIDMERA